MLRAQSILVTVLTLIGLTVMVLAFWGGVRATTGVEALPLLILAALGALIAIVGLSASMIVSAIRNPPAR